jgi:hypothetical protein
MQNEREELDNIVDIYFSKEEVMAFFDKMQYHFDKVISKSVSAILETGLDESVLIKLVAEHYSDKVQEMIDYCKDFIALMDDNVRIPIRSIINIFDTVQVDLVAMNETSHTEFPEIELINPEMEPELRLIILEMALRIVDEDFNNLSSKFNERVQDAIIIEVERRRLKDEGLI